MPKIKTSKTAKKRVKVTGTGKLKRRRASRAHKLNHKSASRKRQYTKEHDISKSSVKTIKKLIGEK